MSWSRAELTAVAGLASSCLSLILLTAPVPGLSLGGALLLSAVPPGAAVMAWVDAGEDSAQAALTLGLSLTALALAAAVMLWVGAWHPRMLTGLAVVSAISCLVRLQPRLRRGVRA